MTKEDDFFEMIKKMMDQIDDMIEEEFSGAVMNKDQYSYRKKHSYTDNLMDIFVDNGKIYITVDLTDINEEDLEIEMTETHLSLSLLADKKVHNKSFDLPKKVNPKSMKKTFVRGILDIVVDINEEEEEDEHNSVRSGKVRDLSSDADS